MKWDSRLPSLVFEVVGSVAICGVAYAADRLVGAAHRRVART